VQKLELTRLQEYENRNRETSNSRSKDIYIAHKTHNNTDLDKSSFYCLISDVRIIYDKYARADITRTFFLKVSGGGTFYHDTGVWSIPKNKLVPGEWFTIYVMESSLKKHSGPDQAVCEFRLHVTETAQLQIFQVRCRCPASCRDFTLPKGPRELEGINKSYTCKQLKIEVDVARRLEVLSGRAYNIINASVIVMGPRRKFI
jgi:hypothetical protein